ncbi:helix-turn-helix domain-containing protein [Nocardia aurea]|uniref:helix-turn-helix domain-containing protein n=1 Tax=Nocardia aurea TaxID=2144174 RepID=UPI0033B33FD6
MKLDDIISIGNPQWVTDKKNPLGPTGRTVADNLLWLRELRNLKYAELSRRLDELGRPIPVLGLSRIEKGERRVDADDLMALAIALDAPPAALMMPRTASEDAPVEATGFTEMVAAEQLWRWLTVHGIDRDRLITDLVHVIPDWVATDIEDDRGKWAPGVPKEMVERMTYEARVTELKRLMVEGWRPPPKESKQSDDGGNPGTER